MSGLMILHVLNSKVLQPILGQILHPIILKNLQEQKIFKHVN